MSLFWQRVNNLTGALLVFAVILMIIIALIIEAVKWVIATIWVLYILAWGIWLVVFSIRKSRSWRGKRTQKLVTHAAAFVAIGVILEIQQWVLVLCTALILFVIGGAMDWVEGRRQRFVPGPNQPQTPPDADDVRRDGRSGGDGNGQHEGAASVELAPMRELLQKTQDSQSDG